MEVRTTGAPDPDPDEECGERRHRLRARVADSVRDLTHRLLAADVPNATLDSTLLRLEELLAALPADQRRSRFELLPRDRPDEATDTDVVVGRLNPLASPYEIEVAGDPFVMSSRFGVAYEGAPERVHGGHIFTGCDYAMGRAAAFAGHPGVTGTIQLRFVQAIRLHALVCIVASVERVEGRKIQTLARVTVDDELVAEATAVFISLPGA